jgi:hypothetical protein
MKKQPYNAEHIAALRTFFNTNGTEKNITPSKKRKRRLFALVKRPKRKNSVLNRAIHGNNHQSSAAKYACKTV